MNYGCKCVHSPGNKYPLGAHFEKPDLHTMLPSSPSHFLSTVSSQEPSSDWYKPGGTLTLALEPCTSWIVNCGSNQVFGRWSFIEFAGKDNTRLIVISSYWVCNQKFDAASNTAMAQQIQLLQNSRTIDPKPQSIFLTDLLHQICHWQSKNKEILLCMDTNDKVDDPKASITVLFSKTDLINLHHHHYLLLCTLATHQRSTHTIDLMDGTPRIADALIAAWMHPFHDPATIKGNHQLLRIDLDPNVLFGTSMTPAVQYAARGVNSCHPQKVHQFCKQVINQCNGHQFSTQVAALQMLDQLDNAAITKLELIDAQLTKILVCANCNCTPENQAPWSPKLNHATCVIASGWYLSLPNEPRGTWLMSWIIFASALIP